MGGLPVRVASALRRWRQPLATTAQGVDLALTLTYVGLRLINILLIFCGLVGALPRTSAIPPEVATVAVYVVTSAVISRAGLRRGFIRVPAWAWADVVVGIGVLLAMPAFVPSGLAVNTWDAWGHAATVSCAAFAGIALPRRRDGALACLALMAAYLSSSLAISGDNILFTVLPNALAYPGFFLLARFFSSYLLRLGAAADAARAEIAEVTRRATHDRMRRLLHDTATILRLVADDGGDDHLRQAVRLQAGTSASEIRAYLTSDPPSGPLLVGNARYGPGQDTAYDAAHGTAYGPGHDTAYDAANGTAYGTARASAELSDLIRDIAGQFTDLAPTVSVDLARGVTLDHRQAEVVGKALSTLLFNVRRHASATSTVIHADSTEDTWEMTVRDDGVGFDPATTPLGFGLGQQVMAACAPVGVRVELTSTPGEGTTVVLRGRRTPPDHPRVSRGNARPDR